jgi:sorting nexin-13
MLLCNIHYEHESYDDFMLHRQSFWPNGCKAEPRLPRDEATRMRTRVAAKVALLSSLSGEC